MYISAYIHTHMHKFIHSYMYKHIEADICDTRSVFSMSRINLISTQAFTRSSTLASSGVRENVLPNNKLELCWKILFLIELFINLLKLLFHLIDIIVLLLLLVTLPLIRCVKLMKLTPRAL